MRFASGIRLMRAAAHATSPNMNDSTLTVVLTTNDDDALAPLTTHRAKSAIPFGGRFRLIDFALSNCLHSDLRRILVLTQSKSHSLNKHLPNPILLQILNSLQLQEQLPSSPMK